MWEHQVGLYQGANMSLLKTVFEVNLGLFGKKPAEGCVCSPARHNFVSLTRTAALLSARSFCSSFATTSATHPSRTSRRPSPRTSSRSGTRFPSRLSSPTASWATTST